VCACVRECVRACVRVRVRVWVCVQACQKAFQFWKLGVLRTRRRSNRIGVFEMGMCGGVFVLINYIHTYIHTCIYIVR
jgi:hypothetical protein